MTRICYVTFTGEPEYCTNSLAMAIHSYNQTTVSPDHASHEYDNDSRSANYSKYSDSTTSSRSEGIGYTVIFCLALLGNILVVFVIIRKRRKNMSVTDTLLLSLACSDLAQAFLTVLPLAIERFTGGSVFQAKVSCKLVAYLRSANTPISTFTLVVMAIDRYYSIAHRNRTLLTLRRVSVVIPLFWLYNFAIALPYTVWANVTTQGGRARCVQVTVTHTGVTVYALFSSVINYFLPLCLVWICYMSIVYCLYVGNKRVESHMTSLGVNDRKKVHLKVSKICVFVSAFYTICWTPFQVLLLLRHFSSPEQSMMLRHHMTNTFWLPIISPCINPFIYSLTWKSFRTSIIQSFSACVPHRVHLDSYNGHRGRADSQRYPQVWNSSAQPETRSSLIRPHANGGTNRSVELVDCWSSHASVHQRASKPCAPLSHSDRL